MSIHITLTVISLLVTKCISEGTTPDQVHISFTGDMTEMAVVWNTFSEGNYRTLGKAAS